MKKLKLGSLLFTAILCGVFVVLCGVFFLMGVADIDIWADIKTNGGVIFNADYGTKYESSVQSQDISDVDTINLQFNISMLWKDGINITESKDADLHFIMDGTMYSMGNRQADIIFSKNGSTMEIGIEEDGLVLFPINMAFFAGEIKVEIPVDFAGTLNIEVTSGEVDIDLPNTMLSALNIWMTSGEIEATTLFVQGDIQIKITSGKVVCDKIEASRVFVTATSGKVVLSNILCSKLGITMTSGTAEVKLASGISYSVSYQISSGKLTDGTSVYQSGSGSYSYGSGGGMTITIKISSGKCVIYKF